MRNGARAPDRGRPRSRGRARCLACGAFLLPLLLAQGSRAEGAGLGEWWSERFEVHGFLRSRLYLRSPDFADPVEASSWRNELELDMRLRLVDEDDLRLGLVGVLRPVWDGIYELQGDTWGKETRRAAVGTSPFLDDLGFATASGKGKPLPCVAAGLPSNCAGSRVRGEFTVVNADAATFFTGRRTAAVAIDDVASFGAVTAPVVPRSSRQPAIGGNATGLTFAGLRDNASVPNGGLPPDQGLARSLQLASRPLSTPLNHDRGALGDRSSFERGSVDVNRREEQLAFECFDNAHPWCFASELYLEGSYRSTFVRLGRQNIVWGRTDAFRLQDRINPIDLGYHNIFPDLEERRIPLLALDVVQGFGDVGPFRDVSLELAWVFDRFRPDQFGQCGEPYAFTVACGVRADAGAHQLLNFGVANVDEVHWKLENTEPGLRLDFRLPEPSITFSLSGFYTFQDQPVARFRNHYSTDDPNPAALLFLQGLNDRGGLFGSVAGQIENLAGRALNTTPWTMGFDPYDSTDIDEVNDLLLEAWRTQFSNECTGLAGSALADCVDSFSILGLPWSGSEITLEYPRVFTLGASLDYEVPGLDTVLRMELASDLDRHIQDTSRRDGVSESPVFLAAVGLDRPTFIPLLNPERSAFLSLQTFVEHIVDYRDAGAVGGMVPDETSLISTAFLQNFWKDDSIVLTNFVAVDWRAGAVVAGPSLQWIFGGKLVLEVGANLLWGRTREHNLRNVCADATLDCLAEPTTWQGGNWQLLNRRLARETEHPFWSRESFADKFMRRRDELWAGLTYRF